MNHFLIINIKMIIFKKSNKKTFVSSLIVNLYSFAISFYVENFFPETKKKFVQIN